MSRVGLHALVLGVAGLGIPVCVEVASRKFFALEVFEPAVMESSLASRALNWASDLLLHGIEPASRGLCLVQGGIRLVQRRRTQVKQIGRCVDIDAMADEVGARYPDRGSVIDDMLCCRDVVLVQHLLHLLVVLLLQLGLERG